jgi:aromatic-L-amino-acid/L-tryptophan decarboxylase
VAGTADLGSSTDAADTTALAGAISAIVDDVAEAYTRQRPCWPAFAGSLTPSSLPDDGAGLDTVLDELRAALAHAAGISSPGFTGWITQGGTTSPIVAQMAASVSGQRYLAQGFNALEHAGLAWLAELCGVPATAAGLFTSGGSTANLVALGAARQAAWERRGIDVAEHGVPAAPAGRIYASELAHRTIHRSAAVLGLGRACVVPVAVDGRGCMDVRALARTMDEDRRAGIVPVAVVAVAGTTDIGSVDPIGAIVEVAGAHDCWVHVDGAYGLIAHASPRAAPLFAGVTDADSWIVDPHKWLATGVGVGVAYVRDADLLTRAFAQGHAAYFHTFADSDATADTEVVSQFDTLGGPWVDQGVEMSAPPRGAMVWAVLREIGKRGVAERVERHLDLACKLADEVAADPDLELLCEPQLSIVCFRHTGWGRLDPDVFNERIVTELQRTTASVPSSTQVNGSVAIRPCFINPRQSEADVDQLLADVHTVAARLSSEPRPIDR